jgi:hypothetical protein
VSGYGQLTSEFESLLSRQKSAMRALLRFSRLLISPSTKRFKIIARGLRPWHMLLVASFLVTVSLFRCIVVDRHQLGSEAAYDYWTKNGFQWGTEIIQNVGPLAFMHFPLSFTGFLDWKKNFADKGPNLRA